MNNFRSGSAFPGEAMDTRQAPVRRNSKAATSLGVVNEWSSLFEKSSQSTSKPPTDETAITRAFSLRRPHVAETAFTTNGEYEQTRQEVTSLLYMEEDEDFVRPTRHALDLTLNLLEDANAELITRSTQFPRGTSSTSDKGGIYVFWDVNSQSVQLEVPSYNGGVFYIHVTSPGKSSLNKNVSAKTLADALAVANPSGRRRLGTTNATASSAAR